DDAILTLQDKTLVFSHLEDFNDPFECTTLGLYEHPISINNSNFVIQQKFSRNFLISCLTKQPLNSLMWAHYADSHNGVVIGINVKKAGLNDAEKFIIPANEGEISYLKEQPKNLNKCTIELLENIENLTWDEDGIILKQALLNKMHFWSYEEEVRVVKKITPHITTYCIPNKRVYEFDDQVWNKVNVRFKPIYTLKIPQEAFVDVTFGMGAYKKLRRLQIAKTGDYNLNSIDKLDRLFKLVGTMSIPLYRVEQDFENWKLVRSELNLD
ncbi:MAG: DUF2971 domain-containing protein, partial [Acinetobacter sp.]|nr:DUF2971 domain-containing protein [Acinetobacter sp.]